MIQKELKGKVKQALQDFALSHMDQPDYLIDYLDFMKDLETVLRKHIADEGETLEEALDRQ